MSERMYTRAEMKRYGRRVAETSPTRGDVMPKKKSPALQLVELVWKNAPRRSWISLNHTMQNAVATAIKAGLPFDPTDIRSMYESMRGGYWFTNAESEWMHRIACLHDNIPAAASYEEWVGRPPFFLDGRLYVGREADLDLLKDEMSTAGSHRQCAIVSSFVGDGEAVMICVYDGWAPGRPEDSPDGRVFPSGQPKRKIRLTLAQVREKEKARKAALKAAKQ